jgi:hypothetical protein
VLLLLFRLARGAVRLEVAGASHAIRQGFL